MGECALNFLYEANGALERFSSQVTRETVGAPDEGVRAKRSREEILVIGGGPAGLAAAIAARSAGHPVTVVERSRPPIDKACGEGILPAGVAALERLGVSLLPAHGFPIRGILFRSGEFSAKAAFPSACGLGLRRTRLHELLVGRAEQLGIRMEWGDLHESRDWSRFQWIIGADGIRSRTASRAGLDSGVCDSSRFGFRRHYRISPWTDYVEVYWGAQHQVYVTPIGGDEVGIAVLTRNSRMRLDRALEEFPPLKARLEHALPITVERGGLTVSRRRRRVVQGKTLLIGDASGSVDAIAGEGLTLAFRQAIELRDCLCEGDLSRYGSVHSAMMRRAAMGERLLLLLDRFPALRHGVVKTLAAQPSIFRALLALVGGLPPDRSEIAGNLQT